MHQRFLLRVTAPIIVTSLLLLTVGVGAAWRVHQLQQGLSRAVLDNLAAMRAAEELEIDLRELRAQMHHFLLTGDRRYLRAGAQIRPEVERWMAEAERWSLTERERDYTSRARAGSRHFFEGMDRLLGEGQPAPPAPEVRSLVDDVLVREILLPTHDFLDLNEEEVAQAAADNESFAERLLLGLILLGTCVATAGLVAGVGFARAFSRSLVQLSVPVRVAAGRLDELVGPVSFDPGGGLAGLEGVLRVIAERVGTVVERLRRSEREALRAEQLAAVGRMAAGMAHELRNPLTSMKILVQAALEEGGDRTAPGVPAAPAAGHGLSSRDLAVLEEEITRLDGLLQSFLDFARPPDLEKKVVDLRPLVEQTLKVVAGRAAAADVRLGLRAPAGPLRAALDPRQVRQVVFNLLLNGLDAVPAGGRVDVVLERDEEGWVTLRVSDSGCGLPAVLGETIFAPFTTTKQTGLGLGLSICKRIVEAHGGTITAASPPGKGAVFTVRLPGVEARRAG